MAGKSNDNDACGLDRARGSSYGVEELGAAALVWFRGLGTTAGLGGLVAKEGWDRQDLMVEFEGTGSRAEMKGRTGFGVMGLRAVCG